MYNFQWNALLSPNCVPGTNTNPEAVASLNVYKNCSGISHECYVDHYYRGFYYNIWNTGPTPYSAGISGPSWNPYPNELFCTDFYHTSSSAGWWCNLSNHTLTGTQLNAYLANQIALANSIASPFEAIERVVVSQLVSTSQYYFPCSCFVIAHSNYWEMHVTFGRFACSGPIL